jgi:hypothetical protein
MDQCIATRHEPREFMPIGYGREQLDVWIARCGTRDLRAVAAIARQHESDRSLGTRCRHCFDHHGPAFLRPVSACAQQQRSIGRQVAAFEQAGAKGFVAQRG